MAESRLKFPYKLIVGLDEKTQRLLDEKTADGSVSKAGYIRYLLKKGLEVVQNGSPKT